MTAKIELVDFQPEHLAHVLKATNTDSYWRGISGVVGQLMLENTATITADGEPIAVGGTFQLYPGRSSAWALLTTAANQHARVLTKLGRRVIARARGHVEASARVDWPEAQRWLALLGFNQGEYREGYGIDGSNHILYWKVNGAT